MTVDVTGCVPNSMGFWAVTVGVQLAVSEVVRSCG
jgi:hypothetical protein